jgi:hypothetical protein
MTKERVVERERIVVKEQGRCRGGRGERLFHRQPPSPSTPTVLCEIKKVTASRDDKKERVIAGKGRLLEERPVTPQAFFKSNLDNS